MKESPPPPTNDLACVSRAHAAELLDVSTDFIDGLIEGGRLDSIILGARVRRIPVASLRALIKPKRKRKQ